MDRTKADLRALRETAGITQSDLASMMGVARRSVVRWEADGNAWSAPDEAWEIIGRALDAQAEAVAHAVGIVEEARGAAGADARAIDLLYRYERTAEDRMANASARAAATVLRHLGHRVRFCYAGDSAAADAAAEARLRGE